MVENAPDELPKVRRAERLAEPGGPGINVWRSWGVDTNQLDGGVGDEVAASTVTLEN